MHETLRLRVRVEVLWTLQGREGRGIGPRGSVAFSFAVVPTNSTQQPFQTKKRATRPTRVGPRAGREQCGQRRRQGGGSIERLRFLGE